MKHEWTRPTSITAMPLVILETPVLAETPCERCGNTVQENAAFRLSDEELTRTWRLNASAASGPAAASQFSNIASQIRLPYGGVLEGPNRTDGLPVLPINGVEVLAVLPGTWDEIGPAITANIALDHHTGASAITEVWARVRCCTAELAKVDSGADGIECRLSCAPDGPGPPPVLDCRATCHMTTTWQEPRQWSWIPSQACPSANSPLTGVSIVRNYTFCPAAAVALL